MLEARNRILFWRRGREMTRFEDAEVDRLAKVLGRTPEATIACIIPTYKRPKLVIDSIKSILAQDRQDFVIVVVDDGAGLPPDLPADPRLFAVSLSRNTRVAGLVRNVGIRLSRSEYVAFLDDDNTWTPDHLTKAIQALEDGADLVYTAVRRRRPNGTELDVLSMPFDRKRFADELPWVDTNAIVLRRSSLLLFSRLPRPNTIFPREDWEFVWRVSRKARVTHLPVVTVEYLVNHGSYFTTWGADDVAGAETRIEDIDG
jgi:glycosyltransferase involved in cell wall biosynthesis